MSRGLSGKVAVVFGAARPPGIGRATVLRLVREGALVACVDNVVADPAPGDTFAVSAEALDSVVAEARELGGRAVAVSADPRDAASVTAAVAAGAEQLGAPVRLGAFLSGGTGPGAGNGALLDLDEQAWAAAMSVNLTGAWLVNRALAAHMVDHGDGGAIVNLSSHVTRNPAAGFGAFAAAKAGTEMLTRVLARELAVHDIRVNAVAPLGVGGPDRNPGLAATSTSGGGDATSWVERTIPLRRFQAADETAAVAVHLLSEDASFVTGETLHVCGGA